MRPTSSTEQPTKLLYSHQDANRHKHKHTTPIRHKHSNSTTTIMKLVYLLIISACVLLSNCGKKGATGDYVEEEDTTAKKELQGIWINEDDEDVAFNIKGDTVYFPDDTSVPLYFRVVKDTFVLKGANTTKYVIAKRTPHLFEFINQNSEHVRLVKSTDNSYLKLFERDSIVAVNQKRLIKRDTVVYHGDDKYHCYVQVNPTTYKVYKASYNDDGVEVDNVFYDNIIHLSVFRGPAKLYSSNIVKSDFRKQVPPQYLKQSVLSDMTFYNIDSEGIHYFAMLGIPNSPSSFMVEFILSYDGKVTKRIKK